MFEGIQVHIGAQTRTLRLRHSDILLAQTLLPGNVSPWEALVRSRDVAAVTIIAACALRHECEGKGKDKTISARTVCGWLDREPSKYRELEDAVLAVAEAHYVAIGHLSPGDLTGEAQPASGKTPQSPAGSASSALPAGGSSTLSASED